MKVAGIIAEYNPLHSGHIYQMEETRKQTGADYIVVAMSGSYTQRGIPAFFDKYLRAEMALRAGADLVLELPVSVSTGSGEYFAKGAVTLLNSLGVVTDLSFGSECGDIEKLSEIAKFLTNETDDFKHAVQDQLAQGKTYPLAISTVASRFLPDAENILSSPNNTLGIEYLKALSSINSKIAPITIKRKGDQYNDSEINSDYPSATALRKICTDSNYELLLKHLPKEAVQVIIESGFHKVSGHIISDDFSELLGGKLIYASSLADYADLSPELANRITKIISKESLTFTELVDALKTKQITQTRIQRALLHVILEINNETMEYIKKADTAPYVRVLGMKRNSSPLLKEIRNHTTAPVIARPAKDISLLSGKALELMKQDLKSYELYRLIWHNKYPQSMYTLREDYKGTLII